MNKADQKDSWRSPPEVFDPLHRRFNFRYDMAASDDNHLLPEYFTKANSGLKQRWRDLKGWKWCNPPYSDPLPWVSNAARGRECVMLLNQDTSTEWAHLARQQANTIILLDWRIKFIHAVTGERGPSNNKCQQLIIFEASRPTRGAKVMIMNQDELNHFCRSYP